MGGSTRIHGRNVPDGYQLIPPDGGWGYAVVGGVLITGLIIVVPTMTFGLLLKDILVIMNTTTATASWIPSLSIAMSFFLAPFSAMICETYSCRTAAFLGGLLSSTGAFLSVYADRIEVLFITYGVLVGCGHGLCLNANFIVLSQYFRKYYGMVTGIALASYAFGRLVMTPVMQLILQAYGIKGTFLIISALLLHICVGASLYRPPTKYQLLVPIDEHDDIIDTTKKSSSEKENGNTTEQCKLLSSNGQEKKSTEVTSNKLNNFSDAETIVRRSSQTSKDVEYLPSTLEVFGSVCSIETMKPYRSSNVKDENSKQSCCCAIQCQSGFLSKLDFNILKEPIFYIVCIAGVTNFVTAVYSNVFLPPMALENNLKPMQGAMIMSIRAGCEIVGRLLSPWMLHRLKLPVRYFYICLTFITSTLIILMVTITSFAAMATAGALFGIFFGGQTGLSMVMIVHNLGAKRISSALGLSQFIQGFGVLIIGPSIGFVRDEYGSYRLCFYFLATMQFVLAIAWLLKPLAVPKKQKPINDNENTAK